MSLPEFKKAIKDYRLKFSDNDGARLFKIFDRDGSGSIDYDEFLRQIRVSHLNMEYNWLKGEMNQFRKALTMKAFNILDKDKSGALSLDDIKGIFML